MGGETMGGVEIKLAAENERERAQIQVKCNYLFILKNEILSIINNTLNAILC